MKITSFDQIHNRNYKQEKLKKAGIKPQSFVEKLRETTALDPTFATAALLGIEAGKEAGIRALANHTKQFKSSFSVDTAFNTIRKLENRLPLFNIPLRSSQIGDVLTPFVSDEALRWNYNRSEIIESKQGVLRLKDEFQFLNEMAGRDILPELQQGDSRVYFEKTGKVYGNIYLENDQGTKTLGKDVFRMQRPSTKTGAISAIWDAGKRPAHFYKPLSDTWEEPLQKLGFSNEMIKRIRFGGGVARTIIGETTHEFFKGMNRFLKEPVPGLNRLLDSTEEISVKSKLRELGPTGKPFQSVFGHLGEIKSPTNTPFGRLPRWLRPYVHEGYWDKTAGRMAVALAAKGSIYTKLIPSLYGALDYSREKMGGSSAVVTTPLYAAIGMGIGSLVNSGDFNAGVFKNTKLITKTQMGGAIAGAVIGALPVFDKGITAGLGSLYGSANILGARVWDTVGGHKALKRQEELFPGMTNPMTGVGFVLGGGFVGYFNSQLGTAKGILDTTSISQYKLKVGQLNPEEVLKQITSGKLSEAVTDDLVKAFREERIGKIFSVKEAAGVLRGEVKDVKTVVGLMAQTYSELAGKTEIPKEFLERVTTVEGSEELASRLFTHMDELSDIAHKASKASSFEYMSKGFFGRMIDDGKDLLKGRPSFTRGALKGGLAFAGIAQLGAIIAGPVGGNLNPVNLIPGWMISLTGGGYSGKEAEDVYTGKKEVAIRKGRFWSLGSSPWEGSKVEYFRKHRSVLMQSDAEDNALYGSTDEKIAYDPVLHPLSFLLDDEFKYHRENRLSLISPTPMSGRAFSDVPILGDLLGATIGEIIKPTKEFRASEWKRSGGGVQAPPGSQDFHEMRNAPAVAELGGLSYQARDQNSMYSVTKDTFKRMTEQAGLRGFMLSAALEDVGYRDRTYDPVIERSDSLLSNRAKFWSLNIGDPGGLSEGLRRYLTKDRNTYYNPLSNMAPSWLPENDYWQDFKHGNYFSKVKEGWLRLPGAGYETLNPELQGLHPENYSIGHKYKILSDVAYGSNEYLAVKEKAKQAIASNTASKRDLELIATANQQLGEKKIKRSFRDYQFDKEYSREREFTVLGVADDGSIITAETGKRQLKLAGLDMSMAAFTRKKLEEENFKTIADAERAASESRSNALYEMRQALQPGTKIKGHMSLNDDDYGDAISELYIPTLNEKVKELGAEVDKDSSFRTTMQYNAVQRFFGKAWESYTHNADLPITPGMAMNKIAPFQPHSKFVKRLTPIELYAQTRVYGRELQMWQNYGEDFIGTAFNEVKAKMFGDSIPAKVEYQRTMVEYFDKLKWLKYHSLEQASQMHDNSELSEYYAQKKKQTMYGADPYRGYSDIFRALPGTERDFYREFVNETDPDNQARILELAPEAMKRIYIAQWQNKRIKSLGNKAEAGIADASEKAELKNLYKLRESEGFVKNHELEHQYKQETQGSDLSYADWVRLKELKEYFKAFKLPKANFVGFCVPGDQPVLLSPSELIDAENISTKNFVLQGNMYREVLHKFERTISENIITLEVANDNHHKMSATKDHLILVAKHKRKSGGLGVVLAPSYIPISEAAIGDYLVLRRPKIKESEFVVFDLVDYLDKETCKYTDQHVWNHYCYKKNICSRFITASPEFCWLLGYYAAEGNSYSSKGVMRGIQFTQNINEVAFLEKVKTIIHDYELNTHCYERDRKSGKAREIKINNTPFASLITSLIPGKASLKYLTNLDILRNTECIQSFLQGLFDGDGSKDCRRRLTTTSYKLALQVRHLLNILGIKYSFLKRFGKEHSDVYVITTKFKETRSYNKCLIYNNYIMYRIDKITESYFSGKVYDFNIKDLHEYSCPIGTFHNSPLVDLEDVKLKVAQNEGLDVHDLGLWDQQAESVKRKPYVDGGASLLSDWHETPQTESEFEADVRRMIREASNKIHLAPVRGLGNRVIVQAQDTREIDVRRHLQKGMF